MAESKFKSEYLEFKYTENVTSECITIEDEPEMDKKLKSESPLDNNNEKTTTPIVYNISSDESSDSVVECASSSLKVEESNANSVIRDIRDNCLKFCQLCKKGSRIISKKCCDSCKGSFNFQCEICNETFDTYGRCVYHLDNKCDIKTLCKCSYCDYSNPATYKVRRHIESVHKDGKSARSFKCDLCQKGFVSNFSLLSHKRYYHNTPDRRDETAAVKVDTAGVPVQFSEPPTFHLKEDSDEEKCHIQADRTAGLLNKFHKYCPNCCVTIKNRFGTIKKKNCLCEVCGTVLLLQCVKCKKQKKCYKSIQIHLRKYCYPLADSWDYFKCSACDYFTAVKGNLKIHIQNKHKYKNDNFVKKNYRCSDCAYYSMSKNNLKAHIQNNHENVQKCLRCKKVLSSAKRYKRHLKYCGEEPKFKCMYCDYKTKYKKCLETHWSKFHGNLVVNKPNRNIDVVMDED